MKIKTGLITILGIIFLPSIVFAIPWSDQYKGSWMSGGFRGGYKCNCNKIQLELWSSAKGELEGVAMFHNRKEHCLGKLKLNQEKDRLIFSAMDGNSCDCMDKGYFGVFRFIKQSNRLGLHFISSDTENVNIDKLKTTTYYTAVSSLPTAMTDFISLIKTPNKSYSQAKKERHDRQNININEAKAQMNKPHKFNFQESRLIGIWHGKLINKNNSFTAEMMLWSSKPYRRRQVVGIIRFDNKKDMGTLGIIINNFKGNSIMNISSNSVRNNNRSNSQNTATGFISLNEKDSMTIFFEGFTRNMSKERNFFGNTMLPDKQYGCSTIAMFKRGKASEMIKNSLNDITAGPPLKQPSEKQKQILLTDISRLKELQAEHATTAPMQNAQVDKQIQAERDAIKQKRIKQQEKWRAEAREKERAKAERIARNQRNNSRYNPYNRNPQVETISIPEIHGPFDGLHGGSFLNALYRADWASIKQFNKAYGNRKIQQFRRSLGNKPHPFGGIIEACYDSINLTDTVLAIYLFNYQNKYGSCLNNKNSVTFTVVEEVPDTVVRNLIGVEIARFYGYRSEEQFKIKKEFSPAFRRIGRTKPEGGMSTIADFFLNQGGTDLRRQLITGTKQMMKGFNCSSSEIKQIEQNLLRAN